MRALITRPKADGEELAAVLREHGIEPVLFPLLEISPLPDAAKALSTYTLQDIQAVLITSANGVRALAKADKRKGFLLYCVGDASMRRARDLGYKHVKSADGDVAVLADKIIAELKPEDGKLLHICSSHLAGDLQGRLKGAGFDCEKIVLYESQKVETLSQSLESDLKGGAIDVVLLYSPRTAEAFETLVEKAGLGKYLNGITIFALSQAVADKLKKAHYRDIHIAESARQDSLVDLLVTFKVDFMTDKKEETKKEDEKPQSTPATKETEPPKGQEQKETSKDTSKEARKAQTSPFEKAQQAKPADKKDPPKPQPSAKTQTPPKKGAWKVKAFLVLIVLIGAAGAGGYFTQDIWVPKMKAEIAKVLNIETAAPVGLESFLTDINSLKSRVSSLEQAPTPVAQDPVDLSPLQERLAALETKLATLQVASGDGEKIAEFEAVVAKMESMGTEGLEAITAELESVSSENQVLKDQIASLQARLADLESAKQAERSASDVAQARLAAYSALRAALLTSQSFAAELSAFKAVSAEDEAIGTLLETLQPFANTGVASLAALQAAFQKDLNDIVRASTLPQEAGWIQETVKNITSLVTIRRTPGQLDGDGALASVSRAEFMLEKGDLSGAVSELETLSGPTREAATPWLTTAKARLQAMNALSRLQARLLGDVSTEAEQ